LSLPGDDMEILLPLKYIPEGIQLDDFIDVFVYNDNENRPVATTLRPHAQVGEFGYMTVRQTNEFGAFLDWGIAKDLFVPFREQRAPMQEGKSYLVYVYIDDTTGRIAASSKYAKFIDKDLSTLSVGQEVELMISERTDLGYKAIINQKQLGLLYKNELFENLYIGNIRRGFIKQIREDGKIDLSLQKQGYEQVQDDKHKLIHQLKQNKGSMALGDKSEPEEIYRLLKMSKKNFKKIIGGLYKDRIIEISDFEIRLK